MKLISIVVPMYNESPVVDIFFKKINEVLSAIKDYRFEIVVVNDGSKDNTLELLKKQQRHQENLVIVNLSRNFGHEPAVAAGLKVATGEAIIPMDADLQDPPDLISELLKKFEEGFEVVNAKRASREDDSFMKRTTAKYFYAIIGKISGKVKIPNNVGHFRLISRRVADEVNRLSEKNRVFRIEVPYVGYKTTEVLFKRPKRAGGESHYNYKSMFKLAGDAIASSTSTPLNWPLKFTVMFSVIFGMSVIAQLLLFILGITGVMTPLADVAHLAWLTINIVALLFLFTMFFLSVMALYLARVFIETQNRPFFVIDEVIKGSK
ncbi:MAG TPA: glycosyltransferase family 2 protein [Bacilli bacterium]|nr:glycosyltransferase family 2 protein [Bacilli bacterium]